MKPLSITIFLVKDTGLAKAIITDRVEIEPKLLKGSTKNLYKDGKWIRPEVLSLPERKTRQKSIKFVLTRKEFETKLKKF